MATNYLTSGFFASGKFDGYVGEAQLRYRSDIINVIAGGGYIESDGHDNQTISYFDPFLGSEVTLNSETSLNMYHGNGYIYTMTQFPKNMTWTLGLSYDRYNAQELKTDQFNPKFGVMYTPWEGTTVRAAAFRVFKRPFLFNQTIEPTQVAGFNQLFDDGNGTEYWRYGFGIDQKLLKNLFGGVEYSWRDLKVTYGDAYTVPGVTIWKKADWDEHLFRAYLNWAVPPYLAFSAEYQYERFDRGVDFPGTELLTKLITQRVPLAVNFFHPTGVFRAI